MNAIRPLNPVPWQALQPAPRTQPSNATSSGVRCRRSISRSEGGAGSAHLMQTRRPSRWATTIFSEVAIR